jgi:hypothetical protein
MSRITSGRIRKKAGKKKCLQPCSFKGVQKKKSRSEKVKYPKVHLTVSLKYQSSIFSKFFMVHLPVLCEGEEQGLVKRITDCSQKGFPQRQQSVLWSVNEFPTVHQRNTF